MGLQHSSKRQSTSVLCFALVAITAATQPKVGDTDEGRRFNILPGAAYDPLSDTVNGQLFQFTYTMNKRTPDDSAFLVPDQVQMQRVLRQKVDMMSTVITTMDEYARSEGSGIGAEGSYRGITASFGSDSDNAKSSIAKKEVALTSTVAKVHNYDLIIDPTTPLAGRPQLLISSALCALEENDTRQAEMLLAKLIDEYGSAFLTSVQLGHKAKIVDYISKDYQQQKDHQVIAQEAKLSFFGLFSIGSDSKTTEDSLKEYTQSIEHSYAELTGCGRWVPKMSYENWSTSCAGADALLGGQAYPIHGLINTVQFPGIESAIVQKARDIAQSLCERLVHLNAYSGCMDPKSPSFSLQHNIHDPMSCLTADEETNAFKTYVFGGVYTRCLDGSYCDQNNIFTQTQSCPRDLYPVVVGWNEQMETFACVGELKPEETFQYFGGFYSDTAGNPFVGNKKECPASYAAIPVESDVVSGYGGLTFCLAERGETFQPHHIFNFGGLYTCEEGNMVMKNTMFSKQNQHAAFKCPPGYNSYMASQEMGGDFCPLWMCLDKKEVKMETPRHLLSSMWKDMPRYGYCHAKDISQEVGKSKRGDVYLGHAAPAQSPFLMGTKAQANLVPLYADNLPSVQSEEVNKVIAFIENALKKENEAEGEVEDGTPSLDRAAVPPPTSQWDVQQTEEGQEGGLSVAVVVVLAVACAVAGAALFVGVMVLAPRLAKLRHRHSSPSSEQGPSSSPAGVEKSIELEDTYTRLNAPLIPQV